MVTEEYSAFSFHQGFIKKKNSTEYILKTLWALFNHSSPGSIQSSKAERSSEELYKMKEFYRQKRAGISKLYFGKEQVGFCKVTFFGELAGVYQADYLTSVDQTIPDSLV